MTYKQQAEELKEKYSKLPFIMVRGDSNSIKLYNLKKEAKALKAKIEAEGCGFFGEIKWDGYKYWDEWTCGTHGKHDKQHYCPDCQEAIKKLDEVLR